MPRWMAVIISAAINAVLNFGTAYMALLQIDGLETRADIPELAMTIAVVGASLAFLKDMQSVLMRPQVAKESGQVSAHIWPILVIGLLFVLSGCGLVKSTVAAFAPAAVCAQQFDDMFYVTACEADRIVDAAYREIERKKATSAERESYQDWLDKANSADDKIRQARNIYELNGLSTLESVEGLESLLTALEGWVDGLE